MVYVSTLCNVGVYKPVGVERAILISACGRTVRVGFAPGSDMPGVMEERKSGHSSMDLERVLRRIGRYVRRVYC